MCSRSYTDNRRGRKETEVARRIKGESKGKRKIQPVISSLSILHSPEHTKRFTELGREEKGEGGDRGDLVEKKESPKGREQSSQKSRSQVKMGPEDWVLKGTKLVTNT